MNENENYGVVTIALSEQAQAVVHMYGPYTQLEAQRMVRQFKNHGIEHSFARKLQLKNEVTAKPKSPKG